MQLLLTLDELKIVTRVLEKCLAHAQGDEFVQKRSVANHLLDKVLERNLCLSSDELEDSLGHAPSVPHGTENQNRCGNGRTGKGCTSRTTEDA